ASRELGLAVVWLVRSRAALLDFGKGASGFAGRLVPWVLLAVAAVTVCACRRARPAARRLGRTAVTMG
ncbi:MAG: hypothetical protein ACREQ5_20340, partial [Candidatus Dormibacteria bacterium]